MLQAVELLIFFFLCVVSIQRISPFTLIYTVQETRGTFYSDNLS